jgi:hypothetical protein
VRTVGARGVERRTYRRGSSLYAQWELWPAVLLGAMCKRGSESRARLDLGAVARRRGQVNGQSKRVRWKVSGAASSLSTDHIGPFLLHRTLAHL